MSNKIILLCDDNQIVRSILCKMFTDKGVTCIRLENPYHVWNLLTLNQGLFKGVVLDMAYSDSENGAEITKKIRIYEKNSNLDPIPIIGITSNYERFKSAFLASGGSQILEKPLKKQHVDAIIQNWLSD